MERDGFSRLSPSLAGSLARSLARSVARAFSRTLSRAFFPSERTLLAFRLPTQTESIEGEVFRPRERIKSQSDFNAVGKRGRNFNGKVVRVQWLSNAGRRDVNCSRLGIKTPKKKIRRAVDRNLVKRRVRDVYRKNKEAWPDSTDIVVYCSAETLEASYENLRSELLYWGKEVVPRMAKENPRERRAPFKKKKRDDASATTTPAKETAVAGAKKSR